MKKFAQIVGSLALAAVLMVGLLPLRTQAAAVSDIGFYVQAVIPQNQLDTAQTYFDLRMEPGQSQTLEVEIVNEGAEAIEVNLDAVSASTNPYGVINYKTPGIRDESLAIPFSDIATLHDTSVAVPAGGTGRASFTVDMPAGRYDGVVLGGIVLTKEGTDTTAAAGDGTVIQNLYSYVIGVKLTETDAVVDPAFELFDAAADAVNYEAAVVHSLRNTQAAIVKGMELDVKVYRAGQEAPVAHVVKSDVDMAPNSVMALAASLLPEAPETENPGQGTGTLEETAGGELQGRTGGATQGTVPAALEPGSYTSVMTLQYNGQTHTLEHKFIVGEEKAETINLATRPVPQASAPSLPWWVFALIGVSLLLVITLILLLVLLKRRRKEEEEGHKAPARTVHKH